MASKSYDLACMGLDENLQIRYKINTAKLQSSEKIVQMYVKFLLTDKGSYYDDLNYGAGLLSLVASTSDKAGHIIKQAIIEIIRHTNKWFMGMQLKYSTPPEDTLSDCKIAGIIFDANTGTLNVKLVLVNGNNRSVGFTLKV